MIVMRDRVRVGVPPMVAYGHLTCFEEYPRFMSGVLSVAVSAPSAAHLALDIGGRRVELDPVFAAVQPGRLVCWNSAVLSETFRLEDVGNGGTDVAAVMELDDDRVPLYDAVPEAVLRTRLRMDLKGLKRYCEECTQT